MSILSIALIAMFVLFLLGLPIYAALTIAASIALLTSDILPHLHFLLFYSKCSHFVRLSRF